jgi:ribosomal protein S18 acetylase RimI-like enzyme
MTALEQITASNVLNFKTVRLMALQDADWLKRAIDWSSDRSVGYLAMDAGTACGIVAAFLEERDPQKVHIISMWVAPIYRRLGIGRLLIDAINAWACTKGANSLQLMVTSINHAAIEFYKRNGFSMTGNTKPYPNDPALIEYEMSRSIAAI